MKNDMKESAQIIVCGDLCPTDDTRGKFASENEKGLFNNVLPTFLSSDLLIGNLEFPLITNGVGISKTGPILKGDDNFINVFKKSNFDVLSLANNHIKDCGEKGVINTIKVCKENDIDTVGAGENIAQAKIPLIKTVNGWKIGIVAFSEQEFNIAKKNEAGANFLDPYEDFDTIKKVKEQVDYLIVIYHGGIEYYKYPSPLLQKKCRRMVEAGADVVTCQHSHCIGTHEKYQEATILYGQGNTLFGYRRGSDSWNEGLLLKIKLTEEGNKVDFLPTEINEEGLSFMDDISAKMRLQVLDSDSEKISDKKFIDESWLKFCKDKKALYLPLFFGLGRVPVHLNRLMKNKLIKLFYSKKRRSTALNIIRCEAHNEVIQTILENDN